MKKKYQISAAVFTGLSVLNVCQFQPSGFNLAAAVLFVAVAGAFLVASNKTPETAE